MFLFDKYNFQYQYIWVDLIVSIFVLTASPNNICERPGRSITFLLYCHCHSKEPTLTTVQERLTEDRRLCGPKVTVSEGPSWKSMVSNEGYIGVTGVGQCINDISIVYILYLPL